MRYTLSHQFVFPPKKIPPKPKTQNITKLEQACETLLISM